MLYNLHPVRRAARKARMSLMERRYKTHRGPIIGLRRVARRRLTPLKKFLRTLGGGRTRFRARLKLMMTRWKRKRGKPLANRCKCRLHCASGHYVGG